MLSQDFYCKHSDCLPGYARSLEGLAIAKLLKVLGQMKANKEFSTPRAVEIQNLLKHFHNWT